MKKILSMPRSFNDHAKHATIIETLNARYIMSVLSKTLVQCLNDPSDQPDFIVLDDSWYDLYESLLKGEQEEQLVNPQKIRDVPVIIIHGNPKWVDEDVVKSLRKTFNLIGYIKTLDQGPDVTAPEAAKGDIAEPFMKSILRALIDHKEQYPNVQIGPEIFEHLKSSCEIKKMPRTEALKIA